MISPQPKLRSDLTIRFQQADGKNVFVIKDPITGDFFRLKEAEHFIAKQLDGETPLERVQKKAEVEFGALLPADRLNSFIEKLEKNGLLENNRPKKKSRSGRGSIKGNLLYLRYAMVDPDSFLNRIIGKFRFCFTPQFVAFSAAAILTAAIILIANWSSFTQDLSRLRQISSVPLFLIVLFAVTSLHELAHGLTCKHFGGEVHEMGFMMIYFQPALYCNVGDSWLFPEKSMRLWVGFAGPFFELFIWGLATLAWWMTDPNTWVHHLALIVLAGSGVKTLLNFNPFIKLDGYYLLSDLLEMPNLRRKSFAYLGARTKQIFGFPASIPTVTQRDRNIYLLYGAVATVGSFLLLGFVFWTAGGYLITNHHPFLFILLSGILSLGLRHRLRRLFSNASAQSGSTHKSKNTRYRRRRFAWALIAAGIFIAFILIRMELRISGSFGILPVHNADVRSQLEGIIEEIYISEGDLVQKGQVLARISDREYQTEQQKIKAEISQARAKFRMQQVGPIREEIAVARVAVERARDRLEFARARLNRDRLQFDEGLIAKKDFETTQEMTTLAENDYAEAKSKLDVLLRGTRHEQIEATEAEIARLEAQHRFLEGQLHRAEVRSPAAGIVVTPTRLLREMKGQVVQKGALIAKVYDMKKLTVEIEIPEKEIADIKVGQKVAFKAQAYPDRTFDGVVTSIATTAQTSALVTGSSTPGSTPASNSSKAILVKTEINNEFLLLKPGMTGHAKIFCGPRRVMDIITRRLVRTIKVEFWSWW